MHCIKHLGSERIMNLSPSHLCGQLLKKRNRLNQKNLNIAHIVTKRRMTTEPMFTGFVAIFYLSNCQRWEYNQFSLCQQQCSVKKLRQKLRHIVAWFYFFLFQSILPVTFSIFSSRKLNIFPLVPPTILFLITVRISRALRNVFFI